MAWTVYLLAAAKRTYVGITTDVARRLAQHNGERRGGARSTRAGRPWRVARRWGPFDSRGEALRVEHRVKQLRGAARLAWRLVVVLAVASGFSSTCAAQEKPAAAPAAHAPTVAIDWQDFGPKLFEAAKAQQRLVLLDLGTGWCHWCHVMEETTYRDAAVVKLVREHFVAARVDADAHVDLANRYEDYGWPATVIFDAKGTELVKLRGYLEPKRMAALLQACVDDPTPGPSARAAAAIEYSTSTALSGELRAELAAAHLAAYDPAHEGYGTVLKYLPEWSIEYDLELARRGDAEATRRARATLDANRKLIDPAWGGVWQYSHGGDWDHPHFEKIMSFQALDLRLYAQAFALFGEERDRKAAQDVERYLAGFLRGPDGAFFASQDADLVDGEHGGEYFALDDAGRRRLGMPRIDRNVYARENGWAITGLTLLFEATGDPAALDEAVAAARAIVKTRRVDGGGFRHGEQDLEARYLGDTLAMGEALLELRTATGAQEWLDLALAAADAIERDFGRDVAGAPKAGYPTALPVADATGVFPRPQRDENLALARFTNRLAHVAAQERLRAMTGRALRYVVTPEVARELPAAGPLLVVDETSGEPLHVAVVGAHGDATARELFARALRAPTRSKVVDFWSPKEDPPLPGGVTYPDDGRAAAFVCTASTCSPPVRDAAQLGALLARPPAAR
jgi:uncharacterized protein YyaL (SSP411 family)/predicted GIY-YIG superfamily endonuclease